MGAPELLFDVNVFEDVFTGQQGVESSSVGGLGNIGCFSFYAGKNLGAYGEGGAVVTNNEKVAVKVRMIRDHPFFYPTP